MSASKALETLLVCTCSAQSALSNDINDDFACDKVEKKFSYLTISLVIYISLIQSIKAYLNLI
jgi:hypothetical protein